MPNELLAIGMKVTITKKPHCMGEDYSEGVVRAISPEEPLDFRDDTKEQAVTIQINDRQITLSTGVYNIVPCP